MVNERENNMEQSGVEKPAMVIRQWRVGTFSMGILLISFGAVLLIGRTSEVILPLLRYWPFVLIILGIEMLLYNALATARNLRVRFSYDIFSIFLVLVLVFGSIGLFLLESIGIHEWAQRNFLSREHVVEVEKVSYPVDQNLEALMLDVNGRKLVLRVYDGEEVQVSVVYSGAFTSFEEAKAYAKEQLVRAERLNERLYIDIPRPTNAYQWHHVDQEIRIKVPQKLDVNLYGYDGDLQVHLMGVKSNWHIHRRFSRNTEVYLGKAEDMTLEVEIMDGGDIQGNIAFDNLQKDEAGNLIYSATKTWGNGKHKFSLIQNSGTVQFRVKQ